MQCCQGMQSSAGAQAGSALGEAMQQRSCCTPWVFAAGMHLARNRADPQYRTRGAAGGRQMVAFTSEQAHYSYLKAAFTTGAPVTPCAGPWGCAGAASPAWLAPTDTV